MSSESRSDRQRIFFLPFPDDPQHRERCTDKLAALTTEQRELLHRWLKIGWRNPWISRASDPPFSVLSFEFCCDIRRLAERILWEGDWNLGKAFVLDNLCFINQIDGGDEWLTIKDDLAFESITLQTHRETVEAARRRLYRTVERIQRATLEECRKLEY